MDELNRNFQIIEYKPYRSYEPRKYAIGRLLFIPYTRNDAWGRLEQKLMMDVGRGSSQSNHHGWIVQVNTYSDIFLYLHFGDWNVSMWLLPGGAVAQAR